MLGIFSLNDAEKAQKIYEGVGGKENISIIEHCSTRLRVEVKDINKVNVGKILESGAKDVIISGEDYLQIVIGTKVDKVTEELINLTK